MFALGMHFRRENEKRAAEKRRALLASARMRQQRASHPNATPSATQAPAPPVIGACSTAGQSPRHNHHHNHPIEQQTKKQPQQDVHYYQIEKNNNNNYCEHHQQQLDEANNKKRLNTKSRSMATIAVHRSKTPTDKRKIADNEDYDDLDLDEAHESSPKINNVRPTSAATANSTGNASNTSPRMIVLHMTPNDQQQKPPLDKKGREKEPRQQMDDLARQFSQPGLMQFSAQPAIKKFSK